MRNLREIAIGRILWRVVIGVFAAVSWGALSLQPQNSSYPAQKSSPPTIVSQIVVLPESVVQRQWTHTLKLINAPQNASLLNPGQCIRVAIYSTGDNRDNYLENTKLSFKVEFAGHSDFHPLESLLEVKQIKPAGGDFVSAALSSAGIELPATTKTMASLGASAARWCVPVDASDGTATLEAKVESSRGHQPLNPSIIQIESFETGSKKSFTDVDQLGEFSLAYYRQPNPARLLPALQFLIANQTQQLREGQAEIFAAFLGAAIKSDPIAAHDFLIRIGAQPPLTRAFGLLVLQSAGYDISSVLNTLSAEDQQKLHTLSPLQDPFDLTPSEDLFHHLDMLWAVFGATGELKPVQTISSALSWRADYEGFDKLRKAPKHPSTLTPSIVRGVVYTAAGWSLLSFQRNDPLVADYIDFMRASPDTPPVVKSELAGLSTNPAFERPGGP